ncbi:MAG: glycosyltransferase family 2 protein [Oscillospiraceae bacterium]|nr:glycosyltransferase family 2 protein [Oscillospiraceae bacterium]
MIENDGYKNVKTAVLIPTLCRNKHLEKCLESLKKNPWAEYVDVYIGVDYPTKEAHWPGYREILKLVERDYSMFRSFNLYKRPTNYGADRNLEELYREAIRDHEQFIFMEDDTEFSENYLEYMLKALDYFRDDPDVIAVSGYSYPVKFETENGCNIITQNAIFNMWGAGFWNSKYKVFHKEIVEDLCLVRDFSHNLKHFRFSRYRRTDYINCVAGVNPDDRDVRQLCYMFTSMTDIAMGVYMQVRGKYQAMPVTSKVRNNGFDGTGLFCQSIKPNKSGKVTSDTYDYSRQPLDPEKHFTLCYDGGKSRDTAFQTIDRFVKPGTGMVIKSYLKLTATRIIGKRKLSLLRFLHKTN